jgi:hypothetical protein
MARQTPTLAGNYHVQQTQSLHEALEQHYRRWGPNLIEEAEALARRILIDAGLPAEPDVLVPTETGITRGLRRLAIGHGHQPGSEVWYAAKVIEQVADVRRAIAEKDKDQILHDALHLGTLLMEWEVEHHWGRGIDLYSDRQTWAHHQNKERIESARRARSRHQDMADAVWAEHPDWTKTRVAAHIVKRWPGKLKAGSVRRQITKPPQK